MKLYLDDLREPYPGWILVETAQQAIETKYHGPTNTRGSRITATTGNGHHKLTIPYPYELSGEACHAKAAEALASKLRWLDGWHLVGGATKAGYVFVLVKDAA